MLKSLQQKSHAKRRTRIKRKSAALDDDDSAIIPFDHAQASAGGEYDKCNQHAQVAGKWVNLTDLLPQTELLLWRMYSSVCQGSMLLFVVVCLNLS